MDNNTNKYVIDFKDVKGIYDMFEIISTAMDFPDYFGNNWDAFWDCITDINGVPLYIEIHNFNVLEERLSKESEYLIDSLKRFKHYGNDKYYDITVIKINNGENEYYVE